MKKTNDSAVTVKKKAKKNEPDRVGMSELSGLNVFSVDEFFAITHEQRQMALLKYGEIFIRIVGAKDKG